MGTNIFTSREVQTFLHPEGNKHFCIEDGYDDAQVGINEEMDVSEEKWLSTGARISRSPYYNI